jgi:flagellar hook assembly protein FlgD
LKLKEKAGLSLSVPSQIQFGTERKIPTTDIEYELPKSTHVRIAIFDMLGRHIKTLVNSRQPAGRFSTVWNGTDEQSLPIAAGLYFCKMEADDFAKVIKLALVK